MEVVKCLTIFAWVLPCSKFCVRKSELGMTSWVFIDVMFGIPCDVQLAARALSLGMFPIPCTTGDQKVYFYFFKGPEHYNQAVLSHSFICLPLPYMEGIVLMCNIDLYCVIAIFNGNKVTCSIGDIFTQ